MSMKLATVPLSETKMRSIFLNQLDDNNIASRRSTIDEEEVSMKVENLNLFYA